MDEKVNARMKGIELLAKGDSEYSGMLSQMTQTEQKYEKVLRCLSSEQQDTICDFVSLCEDMSHRKLEIACTFMEFPER